MKDLVVVALGAKVLIGEKIEGQVIAISIRAGGVTYEVAWWDGNTRSTAWCVATEFSVKNGEPVISRIGFASC